MLLYRDPIVCRGGWSGKHCTVHLLVHPSAACVVTVVTIDACRPTCDSEIGGLMDFATKTRLHAEFVAGARRVPMKAGSLLLWNSRYPQSLHPHCVYWHVGGSLFGRGSASHLLMH